MHALLTTCGTLGPLHDYFLAFWSHCSQVADESAFLAAGLNVPNALPSQRLEFDVFTAAYVTQVTIKGKGTKD